jgi:hypothetical protein
MESPNGFKNFEEYGSFRKKCHEDLGKYMEKEPGLLFVFFRENLTPHHDSKYPWMKGISAILSPDAPITDDILAKPPLKIDALYPLEGRQIPDFNETTGDFTPKIITDQQINTKSTKKAINRSFAQQKYMPANVDSFERKVNNKDIALLSYDDSAGVYKTRIPSGRNSCQNAYFIKVSVSPTPEDEKRWQKTLINLRENTTDPCTVGKLVSLPAFKKRKQNLLVRSNRIAQALADCFYKDAAVKSKSSSSQCGVTDSMGNHYSSPLEAIPCFYQFTGDIIPEKCDSEFLIEYADNTACLQHMGQQVMLSNSGLCCPKYSKVCIDGVHSKKLPINQKIESSYWKPDNTVCTSDVLKKIFNLQAPTKSEKESQNDPGYLVKTLSPLEGFALLKIKPEYCKKSFSNEIGFQSCIFAEKNDSEIPNSGTKIKENTKQTNPIRCGIEFKTSIDEHSSVNIETGVDDNIEITNHLKGLSITGWVKNSGLTNSGGLESKPPAKTGNLDENVMSQKYPKSVLDMYLCGDDGLKMNPLLDCTRYCSLSDYLQHPQTKSGSKGILTDPDEIFYFDPVIVKTGQDPRC